MPVQQGIMSAYQLGAHTHQGAAQGGVLNRYGLTHANLEAIANILSDHTKVLHDALAINADQVDGEEAAAIVTGARVNPVITKAAIDALAINADQVDGEEAAAIVTGARVNPVITKAAIDALAVNAGQVDGVEGAEILQRDGSVALTGTWDSTKLIQGTILSATIGGMIRLGEIANFLRLVHDTDEIAKIVGVSNAIAGLKISDAIISGKAQLTAPTELTIAAGVITVTKSYHKVDGAGDAADDLDTINGFVDGGLLVLQPESDIVDITIKHATGNINTKDGGDFVMNTVSCKILLFYDAISTLWIELGRYPVV